jgi:hypothetical protein
VEREAWRIGKSVGFAILMMEHPRTYRPSMRAALPDVLMWIGVALG